MLIQKLFLALIFCAQTAALAESSKRSPAQNLEEAIRFNVEKYELPNGMTVVLHQNSTIPQVSVQQWYKVGSKDEVPGRTGLAHFFEHMMFKGTRKFGKDTFGAFLNARGADLNAFTSKDYTGYYINAPSEHLELLLQIESDRMRNLLIDPKEVASEREVVKEERRLRNDDSVEGGIYEKMNEIMFTKLPNWIPIGSMADLNAASLEDLRQFYKTYYSPNNSVLIVAGDFDSVRVKALIEKYYADLPRENIVRPKYEAEPAQTQERVATIKREVQAPTVAIGYRLPDATSKDHYALDLLSIILGQGDSSRLHKELVYRQQKVLSVSTYSQGGILAGQMFVMMALKPGVSPQLVLTSAETQIAKLRDQLVSAKELEKAKNVFMKGYVDTLKKVSGRGQTLGSYEAVYGDYKRIFSDLAEYQKITPQDLKRVARLYLNPQQRNTVVVEPKQAGGQ